MTGRAVSTGAAGALLLVFLGGCLDSLGERTCARFLKCGFITEDQVDECFRSYRTDRMELPDREKSVLAAAPANCLTIDIDPETKAGCQETLTCFEERGAPPSRFVMQEEGMAGAGGTGGSGGSTGGTGGMMTGGAAGMSGGAGMSGAGGAGGAAGTSGAAGMSGASGASGAAGASGATGAAGMSGAAGASGGAGASGASGMSGAAGSN